MQIDFDAGADFQFAAQRIDRAIGEIFLDRLAREARRFRECVSEIPRALREARRRKFIVQRNGLKNGAQLVITVGAFARECRGAD